MNLQNKIQNIKDIFEKCSTLDQRYGAIINLGKIQPPLDPAHKTEKNLVPGCQSTMYLYTYIKDNMIYFEGESDALISSGLAALLTTVYSGEDPTTVLKTAPLYLEDLQINASLTPNRANGLSSIYLKMKQEALKALMR